MEVTRQSEQKEPEEKQESTPSISTSLEPEKIAMIVEAAKNISPQVTVSPTPAPSDTNLQPRPLGFEEPQPTVTDQFQEIYTMSKGALKLITLINLPPLILFWTKPCTLFLQVICCLLLVNSELSEDARISLQKVVAVMQHTPYIYMINIVGHTDNLPMRSNRFKSNWELSVIRASTVARFLIDELNMNPNQFVVSGYSSYHPIEPNTTAENRAKNCRVGIIISKRLPNPLPATAQNLK